MSADYIEQLRKLAALKDDGILSEEEFATQKEEILQRMLQKSTLVSPNLEKDGTGIEQSLSGATMVGGIDTVSSESVTEPYVSKQQIQQAGSTNPAPGLSGSTVVLSAQQKNQQLSGKTIVQPELPANDNQENHPQSRDSTVEKRQSIGNYQLRSLIGQGGMGSVYRARHQLKEYAVQTGDVVIKLMHSQFADQESFRKRFIREAALGRNLKHEGVANVLDVIVEDGTLALVMEYIDGQDLSKYMLTQKLSDQQVLRILKPIAKALDYLHGKGVIHRDLKPDNIKIRPNGQAVILDFGIAKEQAVQGITADDSAMGTIDYMAPEQMNAKYVGPAADQYALGMVCYEMLAGNMPWDKNVTNYTIVSHKLTAHLLPLSHYRSDLSPAVIQLVHRALEQQPEARFDNCITFLQQLEDAIHSSEKEQSPKPPKPITDMERVEQFIELLKKRSGSDASTGKDDRQPDIRQLSTLRSPAAIRKVIPVLAAIVNKEGKQASIFEAIFTTVQALVIHLPEQAERDMYLASIGQKELAPVSVNKGLTWLLIAVAGAISLAILTLVIFLLFRSGSTTELAEQNQPHEPSSTKPTPKSEPNTTPAPLQSVRILYAEDDGYSKSRYSPSKLLDNDTGTSWCTLNPESVRLHFSGSPTVKQLRFRNGRQKVDYSDKFGDRFYYNSRAKYILVKGSNGFSKRYRLADTKSWYSIDLGEQDLSWISIDVQRIYDGQGKAPQVCITDIVARGYP